MGYVSNFCFYLKKEEKIPFWNWTKLLNQVSPKNTDRKQLLEVQMLSPSNLKNKQEFKF